MGLKQALADIRQVCGNQVRVWSGMNEIEALNDAINFGSASASDEAFAQTGLTKADWVDAYQLAMEIRDLLTANNNAKLNILLKIKNVEGL